MESKIKFACGNERPVASMSVKQYETSDIRKMEMASFQNGRW